jgi:hypothetical protein
MLPPYDSAVRRRYIRPPGATNSTWLALDSAERQKPELADLRTAINTMDPISDRPESEAIYAAEQTLAMVPAVMPHGQLR